MPNRPNAHSTPSFSFSDSKMTAILDQKHYIEELNRHLSGTVTDLQAKMDSLEKTNSKLVEEVRGTACTSITPINYAKRRLSVCLCALGVCHLTDMRFPSPQLTAATDRINSLREEQEKLRSENESIMQCSQKKEEVRKQSTGHCN